MDSEPDYGPDCLHNTIFPDIPRIGIEHGALHLQAVFIRNRQCVLNGANPVRNVITFHLHCEPFCNFGLSTGT